MPQQNLPVQSLQTWLRHQCMMWHVSPVAGILSFGWLALQDGFSPADLAEACGAHEVCEYLSSLDAKVQESKMKQYQQWL